MFPSLYPPPGEPGSPHRTASVTQTQLRLCKKPWHEWEEVPRSMQEATVGQLTQTLRYVSRPRPISLAGQHSRSGQLVAVETTVAHTRSPGMVTSLHLPMMHLRRRTTLDNWNDHTVFGKNHQWLVWYLCRSPNQQSSGTRLFIMF